MMAPYRQTCANAYWGGQQVRGTCDSHYPTNYCEIYKALSAMYKPFSSFYGKVLISRCLSAIAIRRLISLSVLTSDLIRLRKVFKLTDLFNFLVVQCDMRWNFFFLGDDLDLLSFS